MQLPIWNQGTRRLKSDALLLGLLVLAVLSMVIVCAILLSSIFQAEPSRAPHGIATAFFASTVLLRTSSVAAVVLAAVLLRSARQGTASGWLIGFLTMLSLALLITSFVYSPDPDRPLDLGRVPYPILALGAVTIPLAAMLAAVFCATFPSGKTERKLFDLLSADYSAGWPHVRLWGRMDAKVASWMMRRKWVSICIVFGSMLFGTLLLGFTRWLGLLVIVGYVIPALWAAQIILAKYRAADHSAHEKQSLLWLAMGFAFGLWLWYPLAGVTSIVVPDTLKAAWIQTILAATQTAMLVCLYIATFWAGAFDPRLVIRRSSIYGSLSMLVVFLSAVIEEAVSDLLLARLGLPTKWSVWITVGFIAVLVGAVHKKYSRAIERAIDRIASKRSVSA